MVDARSGESGSGMRDRKMHKEILESEQYPEIAFRPDKIEGTVASQGKSSVKVHGMFSIHGVDREIMVPAEVEMSADHWAATVHFTIPYAKWGMKNPSTLFLRVNDTVEIDLVAAGSVVPNSGPLMFRLSSRPAEQCLPFGALVAAARGKILVFFRSPARPIDHYAFNAVTFLQPEGHRKFRLRQVAGAALHDSRLRDAAGKNAHHRADPVTIGLRSH